MILGVIADDFTGASDIANTLAQGGLRTVLFTGQPTKPAEAVTQAGVVALKCRTIPAKQAVSQALAALDWLTDQGAGQIVYKICSTFDSTDEGNIGPVTEALADRLGADVVPVCPAFPDAGRRVFMGHLFVGDRLISETGMADHPLTPMKDPDLRRVLARQSRRPVEAATLAEVRTGVLAGRLGPGEPRLMLCDAIEDADLRSIGSAAQGLPLLTGGSGIALGLAIEHRSAEETPWQGAAGPAVALAGSVSEATRSQIAAHRLAGHPVHAVAPAAVMDGTVTPDMLADWAMAANDGVPLIATAQAPDEIRATQDRWGRDVVSAALEAMLAQTACQLREAGVTRLVCAGGETSGAIVEALQIDALQIGPEIDPGVPALFDPNARLALALKSGNFGGRDFFARAAAILGRTTP